MMAINDNDPLGELKGTTDNLCGYGKVGRFTERSCLISIFLHENANNHLLQKDIHF